ncbi:DNA polymerase III subunit gamma/tau [Microbacterium sp. 2FI]|uniref:DNA polymerase III subunit gamma/tau n=1 Tax=Microbacterium sp. 2FI TaxID=2502193 RepID=UPI0010F4F3C1|nr:DNA polymerase III subunit gamma/tau [Microbacterium sp. 2FI]
MQAGRDDDALTWDGDDDPTLDVGVASGEGPDRLPAGFTAVGRGSETLAATTDEDAPPDAGSVPRDDVSASAPEPMGNATLITLGVLGGIYALFTIGWLIGGLRLQGSAQYLVTDVMYQGSLWLAVLAPLLWFGTVFLLTRASRAWVRFAWLAAGVVLLLPWPFVMIGAVGQ